MTAVLKLPTALPEAPSPVPARTAALINRLRFAASTCRASARVDFFAACALIDPQASVSEDEAVQALLRVLGQALDKPPLWYRPGNPTYSFDERWLAGVLLAHADGDTDSYAFLLMRRVRQDKRRLLGLLIANLSCHLA